MLTLKLQVNIFKKKVHKMSILCLLLAYVWISGTRGEVSNSVVDVSHFQVADIDFAKVKNDGILGVIHKASEGVSFVDPDFAAMRIQAEKEGLLWGAYHFANKGNPIGQADHFLEAIGNTDGVLLALSLEDNKGNDMSPEDADRFVQRIKEKTFRYPIIFGFSNYLEGYNRENINKCNLWIGMHSEKIAEPTLPSFRKSWVLWQYTDGKDGRPPKSVSGIGPIDRNVYNGSPEQLRNLWPNL